MNDPCPRLPLTRREFLRSSASGLGLLAFSGFVPAFLTRAAAAQVPAAERDRSILVLVQLAGGNDGLNTVIPFADDHYYNLRPKLGIPANKVIRLDDLTGLHPAMGKMSELWKDGKLSIVQNVGYPNPNRSHFRSTEIWETAVDSDQTTQTGWIGRYFDAECSGKPSSSEPNAVHIGDEMPQSCQSSVPHNIFGMPANGSVGKAADREIDLLEDVIEASSNSGNAGYLQHTLMDTIVTQRQVNDVLGKYKPLAKYPGSSLGQSLQRVAALIAAGLETRVYFVRQGSYDTHANQSGRHQQLLGDLSAALAAFQFDLERHKLQDQVLTMTFSEFGRRPSENASIGTDHGTAAPLFVMGAGVKNPLVGTRPDLNVKKNQDLTYTTDFRQVYSTVLKNWMQADPSKVIERPFKSMNFV
ncbi:DUF1501 domain-containing protein [Ruficoccus amylovorans]|uniref:DUF1501 domain-containing protein n=1 Tax=Ruficoccus amylovorans TaxID=1804625 RepID=A0A842HAX1_9BACT|nr:DUF1501 domain-containing protein [Ruficoccus amylovorans]MBC2593279.1 DUF1501 domain-containing protein [Ruficoccus amylovorans]